MTWRAPLVRPGTTLLGYVMYDNGLPLFMQPATSTTVRIGHLGLGRHTFTIAAYYTNAAHAAATPSNTVRLPS